MSVLNCAQRIVVSNKLNISFWYIPKPYIAVLLSFKFHSCRSLYVDLFVTESVIGINDFINSFNKGSDVETDGSKNVFVSTSI